MSTSTINSSIDDADKSQYDVDRPLITVAVISFNQEAYIATAVESALSQTYSPVQYILSDDCSTDRTFEIMCEIANRYPEKNIVLNRNERNLGVVAHLNKVFIELATGGYIIPLAGDDITSPDRAEKVVNSFLRTGASAITVNPEMIDGNGQLLGKRFFSRFPSGVLHFGDFFVKGAPFFGGGGYARDIFRVYGPMNKNVRNEDQILPLRASTLGGIAYLADPVFYYREHGNNISFWVKKKFDSKNRFSYEIEDRRNALQNLDNFRQEICEFYHKEDKAEILSIIDAKYNRRRLELCLFTSNFISRLGRIPLIAREGRNVRDILILLLMCFSPRFYLGLLTIKLAFR